MSQSAIRYKGHVAYVKDEDLREFLKLLSYHFRDLLRNENELNWIGNIIYGWVDDHEGLPPGLRDIDLEEALPSPDKVGAFSQFLTALLELDLSQGPYNQARAALVVGRMISELKSHQ